MQLSLRTVSHTPQPTSPHPQADSLRPSPLHSHLLKWIERKVNKNVVKNPFDALERQARRRKVLGDSRMVPGVPKQSNTFREFLRREHKVNPTGLNILELPKQPFGRHSTYNDEDDFVRQHIVSRDASPEQQEQLDSLVRLYRLAERRQQHTVRYSNSTQKSAPRPQYDTYECKSGVLYCPQHKRFLRSYENDRTMYREMMEMAFKGKMEKECVKKQERNRSMATPSRLYPKPPERSNRLSSSLSRKYSKLFEDSPST